MRLPDRTKAGSAVEPAQKHALTARLKSCPNTNQSPERVFSATLNWCPDAKSPKGKLIAGNDLSAVSV